MTRLSGWCSPAVGTCESERAHGICEQRRRDAGVVCDCANFGGHEYVQTPAVDRDSRRFTVRLGTVSGPESERTDRGQADWLGVDQ